WKARHVCRRRGGEIEARGDGVVVPLIGLIEVNRHGRFHLSHEARAQFSGGGGIRTHGSLAASAVFKTAAFDRSATPPCVNTRILYVWGPTRTRPNFQTWHHSR